MTPHAPTPDEGAVRTLSIDEPGLAAGVWTRAAPSAGEPGRRTLPALALLLATGVAAAATFLVGVQVVAAVSADVRPSDPLLARQQRFGWAVGAPPGVLDLSSDCAVPDVPPGASRTLARDLSASPSRFAAWNRLELLEASSIEAPPSSGILPLSEAIRALCTTDMRVASARGAAFAGLLADAHPNWALILDLPGPEAVAVAAALAGRFEPVWTFAGWPHPKGAWPAHRTLGALLYHRESLIRSASVRSPDAAPMLVLDSDRGGEGSFPEYDNRYTAALPPPDAWARAGIDHVLYVRGRSSDGAAADVAHTLGSLHWSHGISVQLVALQDFQPVEVPELPADPGGLTWWWGGSPEVHWWFWRAYGLGEPPQPANRAPIPGIPWVPARPAQ